MSIDSELKVKYEKLKALLIGYGSVLVAYSGGVDSTFLAKIAYDMLKNKAIAVTICSSMNPNREVEEARIYADNINITHIEIEANEFENKDFIRNDKQRCYYCKKSLFSKLKNIAYEKGIDYVIEGSNVDDDGDYRPGFKAISELDIKSPLRESELTKLEIRVLSEELKLPTWKKPSFACLASRIPYGTNITHEILQMIEKSEEYLINLGFEQLRVRYHNDIARIELLPQDIKKLFDNDFQEIIYNKFREIGFLYVTIDIMGYRMGSMNDILNKS